MQNLYILREYLSRLLWGDRKAAQIVLLNTRISVYLDSHPAILMRGKVSLAGKSGRLKALSNKLVEAGIINGVCHFYL
jgi:hypothetical protein